MGTRSYVGSVSLNERSPMPAPRTEEEKRQPWWRLALPAIIQGAIREVVDIIIELLLKGPLR